MLSRIISLDSTVAAKVRKAKPPRWFRILLISLTRAGDAWLWLALGLVAVLFGGKLGPVAFRAALTGVSIEICLFVAIKRSLRRSRPDPATWHRLKPIDSFSFPSGHAMTAFTVASALSWYFPGHPGLWIAAGGVAVSRVLTGQHFVSDVIAGSFMGWLVGWFAAFLLS